MVKTIYKFSGFSVIIHFKVIKSIITRVKVIVNNKKMRKIEAPSPLNYEDWIQANFHKPVIKLLRKDKVTGKEYDVKEIKRMYQKINRDDKQK